MGHYDQAEIPEAAMINDRFRDAGMAEDERLTFSIDDSTFGQIIGRQFNADFVTGHNSNKVLAHSSRDMSKNFIARLQFHTKPGVCQGLCDRTIYFKSFFFRHESSKKTKKPRTGLVYLI